MRLLDTYVCWRDISVIHRIVFNNHKICTIQNHSIEMGRFTYNTGFYKCFSYHKNIHKCEYGVYLLDTLYFMTEDTLVIHLSILDKKLNIDIYSNPPLITYELFREDTLRIFKLLTKD